MIVSALSARRLLATTLGALVLTLAACGDDGASGGKPVVAATAPQLDALVRELAGDGVEVATIVPATADIHDLELRPSQVRALRDADLIVRPGRAGDRWAEEALDAADGEQLDASAGLPGRDRHWWMDGEAAGRAAATIAAGLDRIDPGGTAPRAKAVRDLRAELGAIDELTQRCLASVPAARRVIVTDHDAVGAFARRYGLTVAATIAPGSDPEAAPSAKRLVELLATIERERVAAVFPIAPHGGEIVGTVAKRAGITLGEPLWADALPGAGDEHDHEHADEPQGADAEHSADEAPAASDGAAPLLDAARRNAHAVASALGAKPAACGELLA